MTPHEKRAIETGDVEIGDDEFKEGFVNLRIYEELKAKYEQAHAAGFEAGLKARLPSFDEFRKLEISKRRSSGKEVMDAYWAYDWFAANMRKGGDNG